MHGIITGLPGDMGLIMTDRAILVVGATGYVGGRLVPLLLDAGYRVRALGRSPEKLRCRPWSLHPSVELVAGEAGDVEGLREAARGCWAAYYLVQAGEGGVGHSRNHAVQVAGTMAMAAASAGLNRIISLEMREGDERCYQSHRRQSNSRVVEALSSGPVPVTILQVGMILGAGSVSFEILRHLVESSPLLILPSWADKPCQPIAIENMLIYLIQCLTVADTAGCSYEVAGPEVVTFRQLIDIYVEESHHSRPRNVHVPFLALRLSCYWIHFFTPVPFSMAKGVIEGLRSQVLCDEHRIRSLIPQDLLTCRKTISNCLAELVQNRVETCWADAGVLSPPKWIHCESKDYREGAILECGYRMRLQAQAEDLWDLLAKVGGSTGWYHADILWQCRGWMDRILGGVSLRRGRRHPSELRVGDVLDFWRVLEVERPHRLILAAEMRTPGEAILEFRLIPETDGKCELQQRSRFFPRGLWGLVYWYALYPLHQWIFRGMLDNLARQLGKPVIMKPRRFTPKLPVAYRLDPLGDSDHFER
jgi:uncharacterized protein YbjT (DUF2867 family)